MSVLAKAYCPWPVSLRCLFQATRSKGDASQHNITEGRCFCSKNGVCHEESAWSHRQTHTPTAYLGEGELIVLTVKCFPARLGGGTRRVDDEQGPDEGRNTTRLVPDENGPDEEAIVPDEESPHGLQLGFYAPRDAIIVGLFEDISCSVMNQTDLFAEAHFAIPVTKYKLDTRNSRQYCQCGGVE